MTTYYKRADLSSYTVKFYGSTDEPMDYWQRQKAANRDGCQAYVEAHFNSSSNSRADYALCIVGSNASQTSRNWGRWYSKAVADRFGSRVGGSDGILVGGYNGRGDGNIRRTTMPAILLEPMFCSNPAQADLIRSEFGQNALAQILVDSIRRFFPHGGTIGFSVGHKYKKSRPRDRGAALVGGGFEAEYAEIVLNKAAELLEGSAGIVEDPEADRVLEVELDGEVVHSLAIDPDSRVYYDELRDRIVIVSLGGS